MTISIEGKIFTRQGENIIQSNSVTNIFQAGGLSKVKTSFKTSKDVQKDAT